MDAKVRPNDSQRAVRLSALLACYAFTPKTSVPRAETGILCCRSNLKSVEATGSMFPQDIL